MDEQWDRTSDRDDADEEQDCEGVQIGRGNGIGTDA
jgi:hypothetical protein